jgi:hypothetical protein
MKAQRQDSRYKKEKKEKKNVSLSVFIVSGPPHARGVGHEEAIDGTQHDGARGRPFRGHVDFKWRCFRLLERQYYDFAISTWHDCKR